MLASNLVERLRRLSSSVDPLDLVAACRRDATITEAGAARAKVP